MAFSLFDLNYINGTNKVLYYFPKENTHTYLNTTYDTVYMVEHEGFADVSIVSEYYNMVCNNTKLIISTAQEVLYEYDMDPRCNTQVYDQDFNETLYYWVFVNNLCPDFCVFELQTSPPETIFFSLVRENKSRVLSTVTIFLFVLLLTLLFSKCLGKIRKKSDKVIEGGVEADEAGEFINKTEETTEIKLNNP